MKLKIYLVLLGFFLISFINAQTIEVKGKVFDLKTKISMPGVNIIVKKSKKGVTTDLDGNYTIKVNANDILVFSNIGYTPQEFFIEQSKNLNVLLSEEDNKLQEVVINVGYGAQKKRNITNAISTIQSDAFDDRPLFNVGQAIQGNAAGVSVIQPSGKPGVGLDIRIRGMSSINSGNNPLYVIDGVQTYDSTGINTDDILDFQILKDATSTAIFGVNGSAGVIIITTKRGKANKNIFRFNSYFGSSKIVKNIDVLNSDQYRNLMTEISTGYVGYLDDPKYKGINTNWRDLIFQTGQDQNYDLSYSGGSDKIKIFGSLGYQDTKGIVDPSKFSRLSGRINIDIDANTWLKAHINMNLIHSNLSNTSDNNSANQGGVILSTLTTPAFLPVYAQDLVGGAVAGGQLDGQFAANPVASLENPVSFQSRQEDNKTSRYLANFGLDVKLAKNLVWKPNSTVDVYRSVYEFFVDSFRSNFGRGEAANPQNTKGIGREHTARNYNWNLENTVNYVIKSDNHDINLLIGSSLQKQRYDQLKIEGTGFDPILRKLDISQMMLINRQSSDTIAREKNYESYFGRATYNYKGKYILNGVFRASGASQLAKGNKWGYFPGISAAWIVSNEEFLKKISSISELKLRFGWGQAGNINNVSDYSSFGLRNDDQGTQRNYVNDDLTWETTTEYNLGLDVGVLNDRVKLSVDAFKKITSNLFQDLPIFNIPYFYNSGKLENIGVEFALNTVNFKGDFNWNTNFNISFIKNKILEMGRYNKVDRNGYAGVNKLEKGVSIGNFYGFVVEQVNPSTGILEYKDLNGDGKISTNGDDETTIGNAMPDYTFGMTNTLSYKGFALDILVTGSQGNDIFNASRIDLEGMIDNKNQSIAVLNRWTTDGQIADIPKAGPSEFQGVSAVANSTRWIEDGSYVRVKAATVGYNFKKLFLGLNSLKLYATGQNLITWTNYSGFDPEVSAFGGNSGTGQGIDYGTYPQVVTYIFGIKAGF